MDISAYILAYNRYSIICFYIDVHESNICMYTCIWHTQWHTQSTHTTLHNTYRRGWYNVHITHVRVHTMYMSQARMFIKKKIRRKVTEKNKDDRMSTSVCGEKCEREGLSWKILYVTVGNESRMGNERWTEPSCTSWWLRKSGRVLGAAWKNGVKNMVGISKFLK